MKNLKIHIILITSLLLIQSCAKEEVFPESNYYNALSFPDSSSMHPKAAIYQEILDDYINNGGVGVSILIRDQYGTWLGTGGYADIKSNVRLQPGNRFLIASTSKTFTAVAVFLYIEEGLISLDDPVNKWISHSITDKIDNANESTIKDLLGHTSSIRDIYNTDHLMEYMNKGYHSWIDEDVLKFVYGKKAYFDVGKWQYSNINYILLGMILEEATGLSLKEIYEQKIFNPLNLQSAYYDTGKGRLAPGTVKGYSDIYSNNTFVEGKEFYEDDIGVGGDGGISINAQDLGKFMDQLVSGNIISQSSLDQMQDWFEGGYAADGLAGYGLYYENGEYGEVIGHGGGIVGFESGMEYFIEKDVTLIKLFNTDLILSTDEYTENLNHFSINLKKAIFN